MTNNEEKVRENRMRRAASRRGYVLSKSKRRDPHAIGFGQWMITEEIRGQKCLIFNGTLDEIEKYLNNEERINFEADLDKVRQRMNRVRE